MVRNRRLTLLSVVTFLLCAIGVAAAEDDDFCQIWEIYVQDQLGKHGAVFHDCYNGDCDDPVKRDAAIPGPGDPIKHCRLYFHIFCEDDGSNCTTTEAILDQQVQRVNAAFLPLRIQFVYDYRFINGSHYRHWAEPNELKEA